MRYGLGSDVVMATNHDISMIITEHVPQDIMQSKHLILSFEAMRFETINIKFGGVDLIKLN